MMIVILLYHPPRYTGPYPGSSLFHRMFSFFRGFSSILPLFMAYISLRPGLYLSFPFYCTPYLFPPQLKISLRARRKFRVGLVLICLPLFFFTRTMVLILDGISEISAHLNLSGPRFFLYRKDRGLGRILPPSILLKIDR